MYLVFVIPKGQYGSKYGPESKSMKKVETQIDIIARVMIFKDVKHTKPAAF